MISDIREEIEDLQEDYSIPKNVKSKLCEIGLCLNDLNSLELDKVLESLDEISNDINIQPYVRSRIWSLSTMLESAKSSVEVLK